jgi:anti-sigma B factor antagonist
MTYRITDRQLADDVFVISLAGDGDLIAAPELRAHVDQAIGRGAHALLLDLTAATFVDSTALGILVDALKRLRPRGGRVAVACPDPGIRKVFDITGLDRMLPVLESVPDALAVLGEPPPPPAPD